MNAESSQSKRVVLVTGASRGIGAGIARELAKLNYRLVLTGRDREALSKVADETESQSFACDLTDGVALDALLTQVAAEVGPIDVLINNAGVAHSVPLAKTTDQLWEDTFAINVMPVFRMCRTLVPQMAKRGWGRVVNIASNAGLTGYAYTAAYCASKHAVVGFTRALAAEFAKSNVTINAICPGFVDTEMSDRTIEKIMSTTGRSAAQAREAIESLSPQKRLMTVQEVAHLTACLLGENARGIHGQAIALDGGQVLK